MQFDIRNRWSGRVQFTAEIECDDNARNSVKIGLAVKWAIERGADLTGADLTGAVLTGAVLTDAVLRGAVLRDAVLTDAVLRGAVLTGAVLTGAVLRGAVLTGAVLTGAVLTGADLTGAVLTGAVLTGASIPVISHIDAAILASIEANKAAGTNGLAMRAWHGDRCDETNWCQTTHCRAGYAICLAGAAGFALEHKVGSAAAGALIYAASRPGIPVPNFYASDEDAMADIKACAAADPLPMKSQEGA